VGLPDLVNKPVFNEDMVHMRNKMSLDNLLKDEK